MSKRYGANGHVYVEKEVVVEEVKDTPVLENLVHVEVPATLNINWELGDVEYHKVDE